MAIVLYFSLPSNQIVTCPSPRNSTSYACVIVRLSPLPSQDIKFLNCI